MSKQKFGGLKFDSAVDVRIHGAIGDGTTDDSSAIQAAIDAMPAAGGVILFPITGNEYVCNAATLTIGDKPITFKGFGWRATVATFGNAAWDVANAIKGSVIKCTGTADGITINAALALNFKLEDIAILGPGSGTTTGITCIGASTSGLKWRNVIVANFSVGVGLNNTLDNSFYDLHTWGCTTGIKFTGQDSDMQFFNCNLQACTTAISIEDGSSIHFRGGLIQNNTTGIDFVPAVAAGVNSWTFEGIWTESNTATLDIDTTNAAVTDILFSSCRSGDTYTFAPTLGNTIARLTLLNCNWGGTTFNLPAGMTDITILGGVFADVSYDGATSLFLSFTGDKVSSIIPVTITPAATITPDLENGDIQQITVDQDTTINVPINISTWAQFTLIIRQDGTGGHDITWGGGAGSYFTTWSNFGNTANKYSSISFRNVGGNSWVQVGGQVPYLVPGVQELENTTADNTLTAAESGKIITNLGDATGIQTHTLPAGTAGLTFTFAVVDTAEMRIDPQIDAHIIYSAGAMTNGEYLSSSTVGSSITLTGLSDGNWFATGEQGTWVEETP